MRYAFMSFSLPEADLQTLVKAAADYGYDGIEPRIDGGHKHGIETSNSAAERQRIKGVFDDAGVAVACIAAGCTFADASQAAEQQQKARAAIDLAADLGSDRVRVFGGKLPDGVSREEATVALTDSLTALAPYAADHGVIIALETHDAWTAPEHVAEVMRRVDNPAIGVNWDLMHPPRTGNSTMEDSYQVLRQWIRHVHMHDATSDPSKLDFKPMGEGEFDHRIVLRLLQEDDYTGYLSGEWIGWEPGEVHLPREIKVLREYEAALT